MLFSLFSVLFQNLEFIFKMLNRCSGKQGRGCSRFLADNQLICHSYRDCSQDYPCNVCSDWSTLTLSKSIKAISKLSRRTNLDKTGKKMQTEGASRESSRPLQEGNEAPVTDQMVSDVEVPSSFALTAGSNLGAPLPECSTAGNCTGNSSQSACRRESEGDSGNQRPRPSEWLLRCQTIRHNDRVHGSHSRSRRSHRSPSGSTYRRPRAYRSRSRGKSRSAIHSHSRCHYCSISTTKNHCSRSCIQSFSRSSSGSFNSHGWQHRCGHSHHYGRSHSCHSRRGHRPHRGHHSHSEMTSRWSHHRSRRSRSHGRRHITCSPSVSSGSSHPSLEPKRRLRFQNESTPPSLVSTNTASVIFLFSAISVTASQSSMRDNVVHSVQPDMRNLICQILTEELRSTTAIRKRSWSGRDRRVRRNSPSLSNPSNVDKTSQSTCNTDSTEVGDRGLRAKSPLIIFSLLFRNRKYCSDWNLERKLMILVMNRVIKRMRSLTIWYSLY